MTKNLSIEDERRRQERRDPVLLSDPFADRASRRANLDKAWAAYDILGRASMGIHDEARAAQAVEDLHAALDALRAEQQRDAIILAVVLAALALPVPLVLAAGGVLPRSLAMAGAAAVVLLAGGLSVLTYYTTSPLPAAPPGMERRSNAVR